MIICFQSRFWLSLWRFYNSTLKISIFFWRFRKIAATSITLITDKDAKPTQRSRNITNYMAQQEVLVSSYYIYHYAPNLFNTVKSPFSVKYKNNIFNSRLTRIYLKNVTSWSTDRCFFVTCDFKKRAEWGRCYTKATLWFLVVPF